MIWLMKLLLMATQHFRSGHHQNSISPSNIQLGKTIKSLSKMIVIITLYLPKGGGPFSLIFFQFSNLILWFLIFSVVESNTKADLCRSLLFARPNTAPSWTFGQQLTDLWDLALDVAEFIWTKSLKCPVALRERLFIEVSVHYLAIWIIDELKVICSNVIFKGHLKCI